MSGEVSEVNAPVTYGRLDQTPRVETDGFEHLNNFVLFNDGRDVMVKAISGQEALTSNLVQCTKEPLSPSCRYYQMTVKQIEEGEDCPIHDFYFLPLSD